MPATDLNWSIWLRCMFGIHHDGKVWKKWQNSRKLSTMKNDEKHSAGCIPWSHWTRFNQQSQDGKSHTLQAATVQHCGLCTFKLWTVNRKRDFPGGYCIYSSGQATKKNPPLLLYPFFSKQWPNWDECAVFVMLPHDGTHVKTCQNMSKYHKIPWNLPWKTWKRIVPGFLTLSPVHALSAVQDTVGSSLGQPIGSTWPQIADLSLQEM